jgi:hypothetical protein
MADTTDDHGDSPPLSERFLDLVVFLPTGLAVTLVEELPRLAERGRERLGVQVNSARAVGRFAVKAGHHELRKRSEGLKRTGSAGTGASPEPTDGPRPSTGAGGGSNGATATPPRLRAIPRPPASTAGPGPTTAPASGPVTPAPTPSVTPSAIPSTTPPGSTPGSRPARPANANVHESSSLAIPGFDTLSASQVVQRLDGLTRSELVAVRAYETAARGRRTILSRVDQLLDERS